MLGKVDWKPLEIQVVLVNRGPGSYTGLRVGIMSAKAFAYATGCAAIAVDGFYAVAKQAPLEAMQIDIIADAQRGLVYQQRFNQSPKEGEVTSASLAIVDFSTWIQKLQPGSWVSGPGLRKYAGQVPKDARITAEALWDPHPAAILEIGLARYRTGDRDDPWKLEPLYLRPSSAEEKWAALDQCPSQAQGGAGE
jgi:tRNA threonylcarbamoyladenosine biosynthesis protein TsaB